MKKYYVLIAVLICSAIPAVIYCQLSDQSRISVITCRPGDDIYNTFGHTAIRVTDPVSGKNELYNYGIFDFETPGFTRKFLRGKLLYYLGLQSFRQFMASYDYEKRSVLEQRLHLSLEDRNEIYRALRENYKPENRAYLYDFFFDNCSTRPRDILLNNVDSIILDSRSEVISFRHLLDKYLVSKPWLDFGIDLLVGSIADNPASIQQQMFLPEYLYLHLENAVTDKGPLVAKEVVLLNHENLLVARSHRPWFTPLLCFGILFLLELGIFTRQVKLRNHLKLYDRIWFGILGLGSVVITFMWFGTDHIATKNNLNLLWMNPLWLGLIFIERKWMVVTCIVSCILALLISPFVQELHSAAIIIISISLLKLFRYLRK